MTSGRVRPAPFPARDPPADPDLAAIAIRAAERYGLAVLALFSRPVRRLMGGVH